MPRFGVPLMTALIAAGAACAGDDGPAAATTMDADAAELVGRQAADLFGATAAGLTAFDADEAFLGLGYLIPTGPSTGPSSRPRPLLAPLARALAGRAPGCSPAQSDNTDTDGDGISDDNTVTFTAANCTTVDEYDIPLVATGTIRIRDQGSIFGWQVDFSALTLNLGDATDHLRVTVNGSYRADVGAASASATQKISAIVASTSEGNYSFSDDWTLDFTPDGQGVIPAGGPWPAGAFALDGVFNYAEGGRNFTLNLLTSQPLTIDGQCAGQPPFESGLVVGELTSRISEGFVITFEGCGLDPTVGPLANQLQ